MSDYYDDEDSLYSSDPFNYMDDSFGTFARNLPIEQPSGSVVSGGREDLYHKYSQMLSQEPESSSILQDYLGRRPTREQYGSSTRGKLFAAALGFSEGVRTSNPSRAYGMARSISDEPYNDALKAYTDEGRYVKDQMQIADNSRNRQMQGILNQIRYDEQNNYNRQRLNQQNERDKQNFAAKQRQDANNETRFKQTQEYNTNRLEEQKRHNRAMEINKTSSTLDDKQKLSPFQKQGLKRYESLTRPDDKLVERNFRAAIARDPSLMSLFEDMSDAKTIQERNQLVPRSNLTPLEQQRLRNLTDSSQDFRLLDSLGFGEN